MANKNFKVRQGLEAPLIAADNGTTAITLSDNDVTVVGDLTVTSNTIKSSSATAITLSGANITVAGTLDVQGGTITDSTGALSITTASNGDLTLAPNGTGTVIVSSDLAVNGATSADITTTTTTASVFNTTATTLNIGGAATTTNIGSKTGSSIINGTNRFTSPTIYGFSGGATTPSRGLMISNGNTSSFASVRPSLLMRAFPTATATSARGVLFFENARGNETTPIALASGDLLGEVSATGYATNGWVGDFIASVPGTAYFTPTETWANTGGPYPTAGTVTNSGLGYILALQPTATNLTAGGASRINVLNINPQTFACRSDAYTWANGKTGTTQRMALDVSGNLVVSANITSTTGNISTTAGSISANSAFDVNQALSATSNLLNTNTTAGSSVGITTNYWTSSAKTTLSVPQSGNKLGNLRFNSYSDTAGTFALGSQVSVEATENWTSTANGSRVIFFANKKLESYTTGHVAVISAAPDSSAISSDIITLENSAGTDYAVLNSTSATFAQPVGFPVKTAAQWNAITGAVGRQVCVSNSGGGGNPNGMMAFWDTTNARWSYIHDNSAV